MRHGPDFGTESAVEYVKMASDFVRRGVRGDCSQKVDKNDVTRYYDPDTNHVHFR